MRWLMLCAAMAPSAAAADVLVTTRTLRAGTPITEADVALVGGTAPPGAVARPDEVIGMEARVTLYSGRPIPRGSIAEPALVERNQMVALLFQHGGLEIRAEGRALGRGSAGESIRIMNLSSRNMVSGRVVGAGLVAVQP
ncbi:MAG: flagella basal body P-ring formation protein FlgA [Rhodobacteraceae bacterium HLUCCA12]|nr:MAG: flagella basal body P-ring formation protein FlgA [Rhodobacteraceae bacterium HLUCCA12]